MSGKQGPARGAPAAPRRGKETKGETLPQRHNQPIPKLPHEHDESSGDHPGTDDPRIQQAARDVSKGLVDTGRKPVVHALEDKHFPSSSDAAPKD